MLLAVEAPLPKLPCLARVYHAFDITFILSCVSLFGSRVIRLPGIGAA